MAFEESKGADEEAAGREGEEDDGVTVGCLGPGCSGGGVVLALSAALGVKERRQQGVEEQRQDERCASSKTHVPESGPFGKLRAGYGAPDLSLGPWICGTAGCRMVHWKKAKRVKRKSHRRPMACQYQAAPSTMIWRVSS